MRQSTSIFGFELGPKGQSSVRETKVDLFGMLLVTAMVILGWFNLYAISYEDGAGFLDLSTYHGRQALFILFSFGLGGFILFLDTKFMEFISYIVYALSLVLLVAVLGVSSFKGAASWFEIGGFKFQPTEFAKVATLMALGKFMSRYNFSLRNTADLLTSVAIIVVPMLLVLLQNDTGSALVFTGLVLIFYREGMHPIFIIVGAILGVNVVSSIIFGNTLTQQIVISIVFTAMVVGSWIFLFRFRFLTLHLVALLFLAGMPFMASKVLKPHQSARLRVLTASAEEIRSDSTLKGVHWQLQHSLLAIGSGGLAGKGYQESTHTRGDFVPEEHTDYIYCVASEEHGFLGSMMVLILFLLLIWRLLHMAEYAKSKYAQVFGYGVASIIMMHAFVNIGMTLGLLPTIGIPLPFFSYGGSSMISFTMMVFVLQNHYSYRSNILS